MKKLTNLFFITTFLLVSWQGFSQKKSNPTPDTPPVGVKIATADDVQRIINEKGIIYDVRWHYSEYEFEGHIPTAVTVPFTEWSKTDLTYNTKEDVWDYSKLPVDKNTSMVFYCMGIPCWKSYKVAEQAAKLGYTNVWWYKGGQPEWDEKKLPVESRNYSYLPMQKVFSGENNPNTWYIEPEILKQWIENNEKIQLLDVRYVSLFEEGRIKGSFQVPLIELLSRDGIQLLPKPAMGYQVVLVSENGQTASAAATALAILGYDVKVLNGGIQAWKTKMKDLHIEKGKLKVNTPGGSDWKAQNIKLPKGQ